MGEVNSLTFCFLLMSYVKYLNQYNINTDNFHLATAFQKKLSRSISFNQYIFDPDKKWDMERKRGGSIRYLVGYGDEKGRKY